MVAKLRKIVESLDKDERTTLDRIDDHLFESYNRPRSANYTPKPGFAPSALGAKCLRKVYYGYWKIEKDFPINTNSAKIFATGDMYEDLVMGWMKAIEEHIPYLNPDGTIPIRFGKPDVQFPISSEKWEIKNGLIDNVAVVDGKLWIYEIKSSNEKKFKDQIGPQEDHKYQAGIYFQAFNELLAAGAFAHIKALDGHTKAFGVKYFYINKNNSAMKEYIVQGDTLVHHIAAIDARVALMKGLNTKKELPKKTEDYCFFCNYRLKCKRDWNDV